MMKSTRTNLFALLSVILFSSPTWAAQEDWLQISNGPQCAADMSKPTQSIFLAMTLRDTSLVSQELAKQIGKSPIDFLKEGNRLFKVKLSLIADKVIKGLDSGELPMVQHKNDAALAQAWKKMSAEPFLQNINSLKCYQVNDINSYYSHLFIRGINESTLEELAKQYKDNKSRLNGCSEQTIEANTDLYPVFNYDIQVKDPKKWEQNGFDYWASFKIYLSWAWRNADFATLNEGPYRAIFKAIPIEEQVVLLSNGCKGLTRPECNSDFLSSTELRSLFTLDRKKLDLTSSTLEMKDNMVDNNDEVDSKVQDQLAQQSAENKWIRTFQKSYMGFTQAHKDKLYQANKVMSSLVTQVGVEQLNRDLDKAYQDKSKTENFYYLCSEARLIGQDKPLSVFKFDIGFIQKQGAKLNELLKYGLTIEEMMGVFAKVSPQLIHLCNQFDQSLKDRPEIKENWLSYRPWYKSYLSRYKILKDYLDLEEEEQKQAVKDQSGSLNYVKGQCSDAIDCGRKVIEGVVNINKILLHSKTFFRTEMASAPLFNERAEKVACGLYDPWQAGKLNQKKLMADIGSSLLFGWTNLPIYLDLNFKPKELVSLNKLIEDDHVKFDLVFDKVQIQKNLSLNFGSFLNVPCSINLSQVDGQDQQAPGSTYNFSGFSVSACRGSKNESFSSPGDKVDTFKKDPQGNHSICGQCAINFQQVSTIAANSFAPLRFIIRLAQSLIRYNAVKNDDTINPRQFNVNAKYLVETYDKFHSIPAQCVPMLSRGLKCQANMCEALAVKEFELKTGFDVEQISLTQDYDSVNGAFNAAYIKARGCAKELKLPFRCSGNGDSFYMGVSEHSVRGCQKESI